MENGRALDFLKVSFQSMRLRARILVLLAISFPVLSCNGGATLLDPAEKPTPSVEVLGDGWRPREGCLLDEFFFRGTPTGACGEEGNPVAGGLCTEVCPPTQ